MLKTKKNLPDDPTNKPMNTHDTAGSGTVCHGAPKIKTVTVPALPVLETPQVFPYLCGTLLVPKTENPHILFAKSKPLGLGFGFWLQKPASPSRTSLQSRTNKAHLFCGCGYSYLGHDRNTPGGSEMLANLYLEYIEEIGTSRSA